MRLEQQEEQTIEVLPITPGIKFADAVNAATDAIIGKYDKGRSNIDYDIHGITADRLHQILSGKQVNIYNEQGVRLKYEAHPLMEEAYIGRDGKLFLYYLGSNKIVRMELNPQESNPNVSVHIYTRNDWPSIGAFRVAEANSPTNPEYQYILKDLANQKALSFIDSRRNMPIARLERTDRAYARVTTNFREAYQALAAPQAAATSSSTRRLN